VPQFVLVSIVRGQTANVVLPDDLVREIDDLVGAPCRDEFFAGLARREVHRLRLVHFLDQHPQGWNLTDHLELDGGAAQWVESIRQEDEKIDNEDAAN
jgi:hypothetical protein